MHCAVSLVSGCMRPSRLLEPCLGDGNADPSPFPRYRDALPRPKPPRFPRRGAAARRHLRVELDAVAVLRERADISVDTRDVRSSVRTAPGLPRRNLLACRRVVLRAADAVIRAPAAWRRLASRTQGRHRP